MRRLKKDIHFLLREDKRFDQARERCLNIIRNHFGNASWLDSVFEHNDNPDGLSYLNYMFKQFMESFYHNPEYRKKSVMRLAPLFCRLAFEANFQNNDPNTDVLIRLQQMLLYIYNMSISGKLDVSKISLDATYDDMETTFGGAIDELERQENDRMNSTEYSGNSSYKMFGPLSFKEAKFYGDNSCPSSLLCYTQEEDTWDNYTNGGKNECYVFLKDGWDELDAVHDDDSYSAYDTYGLSMIFIFVNNGKLIYCNTRWNHKADYADGCECDHALSKEMLSKVIGINFNELFKSEDINVKVERLLSQGVELDKIFDEVEKNFDNYFVSISDVGYNIVVNGHLLSKDWFSSIDYFNEGYARVKINGKGCNLIGLDGSYISDIWYDDITFFKDGFCGVLINDKGWNFINTEGKLISDNYFNRVNSFFEGYAKVYINNEGWNFINTEGKLLLDKCLMNVDNFKNGCALIRGGKSGYNFVNKRGKIISEIWFESTSGFYPDGIACVSVGTGKHNFINTEGDYLLPHFNYALRPFRNGCGIVYDKERRLYTYINVNGEFITDKWFYRCEDMNEYGIAIVTLHKNYDGRYNFINKNGEMLCEKPFDDHTKFSEGFAGIYYDDRDLWTFINTKGEYFDNNEGYTWFLSIRDFSHGYAPVEIAKDEWIYIDCNQNRINDDTYSDAGVFNEYGLAEVEDERGFVNLLKTDGTYFFENFVIEINNIDNDGICIYNGTYHTYDFNGNLLESINHKKQLIRITEDEFYNIIKESVKNIITKMIL